MNTERPFGFYLFKKQSHEHKVLKDMLQFLRTVSPGKGNSFSYIEAETSLHPHLTLFENLQLETGGNITWEELKQKLNPEQSALVNLLKSPDVVSQNAQNWEKFVLSLLKGLMSSSKNLLIDMDEALLSPFLIHSFKKNILHASHLKTIYLATDNSSLWLDCAHTIVDRKAYDFELEVLNSDSVKKHWAA